LMRLDNRISIMVRRTLAGKACVSATCGTTVSTVSAPVLRSTPGDPHLPPSPLPLPRCGRGRGGLCAHTFPPASSVPTKGAKEEGGGRSGSNPAPASFNDAESTNQITPLPQRGRGARGEGYPHLPPGPRPFLHRARCAHAGNGVYRWPNGRRATPFLRDTARPCSPTIPCLRIITSGLCRFTAALCPQRFRPRPRVEGGTIPIVGRREEGCALVIAVLGSTELVGGLCRTAANDRYTHTIDSVVINTIGAGTRTDRNCNTGKHIVAAGWHYGYGIGSSAAISAVSRDSQLSARFASLDTGSHSCWARSAL